MDLCSIYFTGFDGCLDSFVSGYYFVLDCCNLFPGVKLSMMVLCYSDVIISSITSNIDL